MIEDIMRLRDLQDSLARERAHLTRAPSAGHRRTGPRPVRVCRQSNRAVAANPGASGGT